MGEAHGEQRQVPLPLLPMSFAHRRLPHHGAAPRHGCRRPAGGVSRASVDSGGDDDDDDKMSTVGHAKRPRLQAITDDDFADFFPAETPTKKKQLDAAAAASSSKMTPKELVQAKSDLSKVVERTLAKHGAMKSVRMRIISNRKRLTPTQLASLDRDPDEALKDIEAKMDLLRISATNLQQASPWIGGLRLPSLARGKWGWGSSSHQLRGSRVPLGLF